MDSNSNNAHLFKFANETRLKDIELIEPLFVGHITRTETLSILHDHAQVNDYFDKPADNAVGMGSLTLQFDAKGQLKAIEAISMEGP